MPKLKIYSSLDEALEDIEFKNGNPHRELKMGFKTNNEEELEKKWLNPELGLICNWITAVSKKKRQDSNKLYCTSEIFVELFINAYRHSVWWTKKGVVTSGVYIGEEGALSWTKQEYNFLTKKQINRFLKGRYIKTTNLSRSGKPKSPNLGTLTVLEAGDGVFINESEKAIYVSNYLK